MGTKVVLVRVVYEVLAPADQGELVGAPVAELVAEADDGCCIGAEVSRSVEQIADDGVRNELMRMGNDGTFFDEWL